MKSCEAFITKDVRKSIFEIVIPQKTAEMSVQGLPAIKILYAKCHHKVQHELRILFHS